MWFAKTRSRRSRVRKAAGRLDREPLAERPDVWYALREAACTTLEEAKACVQEHHDAIRR